MYIDESIRYKLLENIKRKRIELRARQNRSFVDTLFGINRFMLIYLFIIIIFHLF